MNNFFRDHRTKRDDFVFYSKRLMRIVIEYALSFLPFEVKHFSFIFGKNAARSIMECTFLLFSSSTRQFLFILLQDYELTTKGGSTYRGKRYAGQGVSMKYRCFSPLSTFGVDSTLCCECLALIFLLEMYFSVYLSCHLVSTCNPLYP